MVNLVSSFHNGLERNGDRRGNPCANEILFHFRLELKSSHELHLNRARQNGLRLVKIPTQLVPIILLRLSCCIETRLLGLRLWGGEMLNVYNL